MSRETGLLAIASEGSRLLAFARRDRDAMVPRYPGWQLRDLVRHVASIHARTLAICRTLPRERIPAPAPPDGRDELDWFEETLAALVEALRAADPETPAWCVTVEQTLGAWERRMIVETGLHRWDAQGALEEPEALPDIVALSGLDEFASMWLPRLDERSAPAELPTLEVHARDVDRRWTFGRGEPAARVSATASDLYLRLMTRPGARLPAAWEAAVDAMPAPAG